MKVPSTPRQYVAGSRRMMKIKEAMDSHVVKLAEGASELYVPKADPTQAWAAVEEARRLARPMKVAAVLEKEKQVFYERPRSKVKISTPLDSDAEEVESSSTSDSEGSESSDQLGEWEQKQEDEAIQHWTLETAADTFQELLNSFKFDQRVDTLEELQMGFSKRVDNNEKLNDEMDELEGLMRQDWEQLEQEIAESRVHLEQHELQMFQALQRYFRCMDRYVSLPGSRQKALQELRQSIRDSGSQSASLDQPSDVLEVVETMVEEIKQLRQVLDLESKRHDAYEHALKKLSLAALVGDDNVMQDPVTAQVVKEIRRWEIDGSLEDWVAQETASLGKNEYAARVTRVKAEIEELKKRLERYNARKQRKRRNSLGKKTGGEASEELPTGGSAFQNLSLFDDSVEWNFKRELSDIRKAQKKLEDHLAKFEGLRSLIKYQEPDLEDSLNKILEVTTRATMMRLTRRIERLPKPMTAEEQEVENFALIRQAEGEEDEKEHKENMKRMQSEMELMQKQADDQEQKQMQVQRAIRHEQRVQESLQAEIEEAKAMIESIDDNVSLVVARETMRQAEDMRLANTEKEKELLEQTQARERAEAQLGQATGLFEETKALAQRLLRRRAEELESDSEPSADELGDAEGLGDADSENPHSRASSLSSTSRLDSRRTSEKLVTGQVLERLQKAQNFPQSLAAAGPAEDKGSLKRGAEQSAVMKLRRQSMSKGAAALADILGRVDREAGLGASGSPMHGGDASPQSSNTIRTSKSGRRHSALNAFGMAAQRAAGEASGRRMSGMSGQRAALLAVGGFMKGVNQADEGAENSPESGKGSPSHSKSRADQLEPASRKDGRRTTLANMLSSAAKAQARARADADEDLELGISNSMRSPGGGADSDAPQPSQSLRTPKSGRRHSALNTLGMAAQRAVGDASGRRMSGMSGQRAALLAVGGFMKASAHFADEEVAASGDSPESGKGSPTRSRSVRGDDQPLELASRKGSRRTTLFNALSSAAKAQAKERTDAEEDLELGVSNSIRTPGGGADPDAPQSSQSLRMQSKPGRRHSALNAFGMAVQKAGDSEAPQSSHSLRTPKGRRHSTLTFGTTAQGTAQPDNTEPGRRLSGRTALLAVTGFMRANEGPAEPTPSPTPSRSLRGALG
ncbi:unnamed protein product [Symbiodinium sp. CCMP2456]|nr:unnamed protein product [Symbiodinium sp. CCMP2456]